MGLELDGKRTSVKKGVLGDVPERTGNLEKGGAPAFYVGKVE